MKTLLITGGAGFIGSHFIRMMTDKYPDYRLLNADCLTYAADLDNLASAVSSPNYTFIKADIRDSALMNSIFGDFNVDTVVNLAAQSHVDRSIDDPSEFVSTNVLGTQVLLDAALKHWKTVSGNHLNRSFRHGTKFLQISTDEVYGFAADCSFREDSPLMPNNPYAASKAGADLLVRAYRETYGLPVNITRSCNNYGPGQHPEKLIPLMINNCMENKPLPVYGDGGQVRNWLYVGDHCRALDIVLHQGTHGGIYNISGRYETTNLDVVRQIISLLGESENLISYVADRPGHDRRYAVDSTKIRAELNWQPVITFEDGLRETVEWYRNKTSGLLDTVKGQDA